MGYSPQGRKELDTTEATWPACVQTQRAQKPCLDAASSTWWESLVSAHLGEGATQSGAEER